MKTYAKYKKRLIAAYDVLTADKLPAKFEKESDEAFTKFLSYIVNTFIGVYCIFGAICLYFFITHAIF